MSYIPPKLLEKKLLRFLSEDTEFGDITSELFPDIPVYANLITKQDGVLCGLAFSKILLKSLQIEVSSLFNDGDTIRKGDIILQLNGYSRAIFASERTVLNLLMHLSGIATYTRKMVDKVAGSGQDIIIASTRKTTPGLRYFEKYAVKIGGGDPHRWNLSDAVLIKENHLSLLAAEDAIPTALNQAGKETSFTKKVEIEVENLTELETALKFSPDIIMLDDFHIDDIQTAIGIVKQNPENLRPLIEVSGGIYEQNIDKYLIPGIDIISMGTLTHSPMAIDFSLKVMKHELPNLTGEKKIVN